MSHSTNIEYKRGEETQQYKLIDVQTRRQFIVEETFRLLSLLVSARRTKQRNDRILSKQKFVHIEHFPSRKFCSTMK